MFTGNNNHDSTADDSTKQDRGSLFPPGGFSRIFSKSSLPTRSPGTLHTDMWFVALKKKVRSSLLHTTDQGVPGTGMLAMGRGPLESCLTGAWPSPGGGTSNGITGTRGSCGGMGFTFMGGRGTSVGGGRKPWGPGGPGPGGKESI